MGAKASRLPANFLSQSFYADKEIRPALCTIRDRSRKLARVELNKVNKPVAYQMFIGPSDPFDGLSYGISKSGLTLVLALDVLHIYDFRDS